MGMRVVKAWKHTLKRGVNFARTRGSQRQDLGVQAHGQKSPTPNGHRLSSRLASSTVQMFPLYKRVSGSSVRKSGSASRVLIPCMKFRRESGRTAAPQIRQTNVSDLGERSESIIAQEPIRVISQLDARVVSSVVVRQTGSNCITSRWPTARKYYRSRSRKP